MSLFFNVVFSFLFFVALLFFAWAFIYWVIGKEYKIVEDKSFEIGIIGLFVSLFVFLALFAWKILMV